MYTLEDYKRPRAYQDDIYQWHLGKVPETIEYNGKTIPNPAYHSAIFVVHGMGTQKWAETAAVFRSGFENELEELYPVIKNKNIGVENIRPPFIQEGFWANYDNLEKTFPEDWKLLEETKRDFFSLLWKKRLKTPFRTFFWFIYQQLKLIKPSVIFKINFFSWLLYLLLQIVSLTVLLYLVIRRRKILTEILSDVRIYASPKGIVERTIVQRIDKHVGDEFLRTIGLDWNFNEIKDKNEKLKCDGLPIEFNRIIWVAHSLGTIISYNVLSDLFYRAKELEEKGTDEQKQGVKKFRNALNRFITLGSPLDKIAFLFGEDVLRPWLLVPRETLLDHSEKLPLNDKEQKKDWWINFYHVLDPVSGALSNKLICGNEPPVNYHIGLLKIPGLAHSSYWHDKRTLKFILSRVYGSDYFSVPPDKPFSARVLTILAFAGYLTWTLIILAAIYVIIFWGPALIKYFFVSG